MATEKESSLKYFAIEGDCSADDHLYDVERSVTIFHSPAQSQSSISHSDLHREDDELVFPNDEGNRYRGTETLVAESRRQNLLRSIHCRNIQDVSDILSGAQDAAELVHEVEIPQHHASWPITPLSLALLEGDENMVKILLQHSKAGTCGLAIKTEVGDWLPRVQESMFEPETEDEFPEEPLRISCEFDPDYEIALLELQNGVIAFLWSNSGSTKTASLQQHFLARHIPPHPCLRYRKRWSGQHDPIDPTSLALHSLLFSSGDVEALFRLLRRSSLDLRNAQFCDIGRTLWFWAARKGYIGILCTFLEDGFPINFRATATRFTSSLAAKASEFWPGGIFEAAPANTTALWNSAYTGANIAVDFLLQLGALPHAELLKVERNFMERLSEMAYSHLESQTDDFLRSKTKIPQQSQALVESPTPVENNIMASLFSDDRWLAMAIFGGPSDDERLDELQAMSIGLSATYMTRRLQTPESVQKKIEKYATTLVPLLQAGCDPNPIPNDRAVSRDHTYLDESSPPPVMWHFVKIGHQAAIDTLMKHGADIHGRFDYGRTILHYAVGSDMTQMMQFALDQGIAISQRDDAGLSAIHYSVMQRKYVSLHFLLQQGVSPDELSRQSVSPLLMAATLSDLKSTKMLLTYHADPCRSFGDESLHLTEQDIKSHSWAAIFRAGTPLLAALRSTECDIDLVESLLSCGADPQQLGIIATRRGRESVFYSSKAVPGSRAVPLSEKEEMFNDRIDQIDSDPAWNGAQTPRLWRSAWGWDVHMYDPIQYVTSFFTNMTNDLSRKESWLLQLKTLLLYAKRSNKPLNRTCLDNCVRSLCTINLGYDWSETGFDRGVRRWFPPLEAIELLLSHGASPMVRGAGGLTLLHVLCSSVCSNETEISRITSMIRQLVKTGAYINEVDNLRRSPLHYAVVLCPPAIITLLECGADCQAGDVKGRTPILYACGGTLLSSYSFQPESLRTLLDKGCGEVPWWSEILLAACNRAGQEPRSRSRRPDIDVEQLIRDIMAMDKDRRLHILSQTDWDGNTALHYAAGREFVEPLKGLCIPPPLPWQALAMQNVLGETPLIKACQYGGRERVEILLCAIKNSSSSRWVMHPNSRKTFESKPWDDRQGSYTELIDSNPVRKMATIQNTTETEIMQSSPAPTDVLAQCLNMQDDNGWTALHYAACRGDHEVVQLLVDEPLLDPGPSEGCCTPSPLDLAHKSENGTCVRLIEDAVVQRRVKSDQKRLKLHATSKSSDSNKQDDDRKQIFVRIMSLLERLDVRVMVGICSLAWVLLRLGSAVEKGASD